MSSRISIETDWSIGACYARLSNAPVDRTETFNDETSFLIDLDTMGEVVGLEILDLEQQIPLTDLCARYHIREERAAALALLLPSIRKTPALTHAADPDIALRAPLVMRERTVNHS